MQAQLHRLYPELSMALLVLEVWWEDNSIEYHIDHPAIQLTQEWTMWQQRCTGTADGVELARL